MAAPPRARCQLPPTSVTKSKLRFIDRRSTGAREYRRLTLCTSAPARLVCVCEFRRARKQKRAEDGEGAQRRAPSTPRPAGRPLQHSDGTTTLRMGCWHL
eukprot:608935-Prymnesium_polylepis.2